MNASVKRMGNDEFVSAMESLANVTLTLGIKLDPQDARELKDEMDRRGVKAVWTEVPREG